MKFLVISTNCDCASGRVIRRDTIWVYGPRCPHCNKILGPGSYRVIRTISAKDINKAHLIYSTNNEK